MVNMLIIEGDVKLRQTLVDLFMQSGYQAVAVSSAEKGLHLLQSGQCSIDIILLDWEMQDISSDTFIGHIRRRPQWYRLPIIVMSTNPNDMQAALSRGASDFVDKPIDVKVVNQIVQYRLSACV
jgi:DNA-binding response OmpR family regulator